MGCLVWVWTARAQRLPCDRRLRTAQRIASCCQPPSPFSQQCPACVRYSCGKFVDRTLRTTLVQRCCIKKPRCSVESLFIAALPCRRGSRSCRPEMFRANVHDLGSQRSSLFAKMSFMPPAMSRVALADSAASALLHETSNFCMPTSLSLTMPPTAPVDSHVPHQSESLSRWQASLCQRRASKQY